MRRSLKAEQVFSEAFVRKLHKKMYGDVWRWAGMFRKSNKNLGVDKWLIPTELRNLCNDALFWLEHKTFEPDEIAVRFKHRIVSIHCFPNGNGRHSRLMADVIVSKLFQRPMFTWGAGDLVHIGQARSTYLSAIRAADRGDFAELLRFARS